MIGVGITTRNRPDILDYTLSWFTKFEDRYQDIVVYDDDSDIDSYELLGDKYGDKIQWLESAGERLGIAKSKNMLIKGFLDTGWDYDGFILFDDDSFPTQEGWYEHFLKARKNHNQHHMIFAKEPNIVLESRREYADVWCGCLGVCIWLTPYAIQRVGGWDPRFKRYGFEHFDLTNRCYLAKLSPLGLYVSPKDISKYIWCFDTNGDHEGFKWPHKGCMSKEERAEAIDENSRVRLQIIAEHSNNFHRDI